MHKELTYRSCSPRCHPREWCPGTHTGAVAQRQDTKSQHNKTPPTALHARGAGRAAAAATGRGAAGARDSRRFPTRFDFVSTRFDSSRLAQTHPLSPRASHRPVPLSQPPTARRTEWRTSSLSLTHTQSPAAGLFREIALPVHEPFADKVLVEPLG